VARFGGEALSLVSETGEGEFIGHLAGRGVWRAQVRLSRYVPQHDRFEPEDLSGLTYQELAGQDEDRSIEGRVRRRLRTESFLYTQHELHPTTSAYAHRAPVAVATAALQDAREKRKAYVGWVNQIEADGKGGFTTMVAVMRNEEEVAIVERTGLPGSRTVTTVNEVGQYRGNGLGALKAIEEANAARIGKNESIGIGHTAGQARRFLPARAEGNKALATVGGTRILDLTTKFAQHMAIPGAIYTFWTDQLLIPAADLERLRETVQTSHVTVLGMGVGELDRRTAERYGVHLIDQNGRLIGFDDTSRSGSIDALFQKIEALRHQGKAVSVRVGIGHFYVSPEAARVFLDVFRRELDPRELESGKWAFNIDEIWQAWMTDEATFVKEASNKLGEAHARWIYGKALEAKVKLQRQSGKQLIASFDLQPLWFDLGTDERAYTNTLLLTRETPTAELLRQAMGRDGQPLERNPQTQSIITPDSTVGGAVRQSLIAGGSKIDQVLGDVRQIVCESCRIHALHGEGARFYHVIDPGVVKAVPGYTTVDVFHPTQGRIRLTFRFDDFEKPRSVWWESRLNGNSYSLAEVMELMSLGSPIDRSDYTPSELLDIARRVSKAESERVREIMARIVEHIIANRGQTHNLRLTQDQGGLHDAEFVEPDGTRVKVMSLATELMLLQMARRGDPLGKQVARPEVLEDLLRQPLIIEDVHVGGYPWGAQTWQGSFGMIRLPDGSRYPVEAFRELAQEAMLGESIVKAYGVKNPLLQKELTVDKPLSPQSHDPGMYEAYYDLKTGRVYLNRNEFHIIEGNTIYLGFKQDADPDEVERLLRAGDLSGLKKLMNSLVSPRNAH
jgi:hypothetical protein